MLAGLNKMQWAIIVTLILLALWKLSTIDPEFAGSLL